MRATSSSGEHTRFRRIQVEALSGVGGHGLDQTYGLAGGTDSVLEAFRYVGAGDADVSMRGAVVEGTRAGVMQARADHIVFWIGDGTATITPDGAEPFLAEPGHPVILSASISYGFAADARKITMLHLSDRLLRSVLAARGDAPVGTLVFEQQHDIRVALGPLRAVLAASARQIADERLADDRRSALNTAVAQAVVDAFPLADTQPDADLSSGPRRAAAWMRLRARDTVTVADIAQAAGLSPRGLQSAFRREFGTTPTTYLRDVRLDGARVDLEDVDFDASVAEVARSWQFAHLGRFAAAYTARHGELPSDTRKRARGMRAAGGARVAGGVRLR